MGEQNPLRITQFDSLRGLAACCVLIGHYTLVMRGAVQPVYDHIFAWTQTLNATPLRIFWEGHAAVVLFFTLSGFVLYLLLERTHLPLSAYAIKRVVRLYIPYIAAVALGVLGEYTLAGGQLTGLNHWINKFWSWPISIHSVAQHLIFLGQFNSDRYDFTIWTLVHEMRISLLFPIIFLLVRRLRWWVALMPFILGSVTMAILQQPAIHAVFDIDAFATQGGFTEYVRTVHYLLAFAIGAVLAGHREHLRAAYTALPVRRRVLLGTLMLALYIYGSQAMAITGLKTVMAHDWPLMAGAALLLTIAAFETRIAGWLNYAPLRWLGRISYSLYLFHPVILLAALHAFYGLIPLGPLLLGSFIATFIFSELAYRLIERPAVHLSRWSSQRIAELHQAIASGLRSRSLRRAGRLLSGLVDSRRY
jgi:peptidoglycan/LPS O-acetylase OafA/YrhL